MGLGNSNPKHGNKGSRFSYELGQLQVLNKILEAVSGGNIEIGDINVNLGDLELLLQGQNGSQETPGYILATGAGNITAGKFTVHVRNIGANDGQFLGETLPPGIGLPYEAKVGNTLGAFTYDATGTTFVITTTVI